MILDSFKPFALIFQIQYENAYLIWDRAGLVNQKLTQLWPGLKLKESAPQQQVLASDEVIIQTGLKTSILTIRSDKIFDSRRVTLTKEIYEVWRDLLELEDLDRVSTRSQFVKEFSTLKEANAEIFGLNLVRWPSEKVFDQEIDGEKNGVDIAFRFDDANGFSVLRVKAEQVRAEVDLDPQYFDEPRIVKEKQRVVIDFDRGLVKPGSANKFRADEWIKGYQHLLRRDIEKVLKGKQ